MIIPPDWNVPESITARLGQKSAGRQRIIFEDDHLLIILHKVPSADDTTREAALFLRAPDGSWRWTRGPNGAAALSSHVQSYTDRESALQAAADKCEDTRTLYELLAELTPVARAARNMHATLQAAREAVKEDKLLIDVRDRASDVERELELLLEDVRNMIQYRSIREAEQQSLLAAEALRASHRLNVIAAIFLPLTAITGIFGMNLAPGIDKESAAYFWSIALLSVGLGFALKSWVVGSSQTKLPAKK
ncbi:MAG TPA: CorA family divalent cation transporter [Verrucomicrobiae bacterium]|nr:CorA family divalent cation transporter [Verrucomicrobiae bacterium]